MGASERLRGLVTGPEELLIDWLEEQPNYEQIEVKGDAGICCLHRYMFTWAILSGLNQTGFEGRWCYKDYAAAKAAYDAWNGGGEPTGWHRHPESGRRRDADGNEYVML